jgi:hypothetical protein
MQIQQWTAKQFIQAFNLNQDIVHQFSPEGTGVDPVTGKMTLIF